MSVKTDFEKLKSTFEEIGVDIISITKYENESIVMVINNHSSESAKNEYVFDVEGKYMWNI